jgi:hypothetical protein
VKWIGIHVLSDSLGVVSLLTLYDLAMPRMDFPESRRRSASFGLVRGRQHQYATLNVGLSSGRVRR